MKHWVFFAAILFLGFLASPPSKTDVGKLEPVELLYIYKEDDQIVLETDTESKGTGKDLHAALEDLIATSYGTVFLETADTLLITLDTQHLLPELLVYLRPACSVCLAVGELDLEAAARYLNTHKPTATLLDFQKGSLYLGTLKGEGERLKLEQ